jgi:hypothetical protein
MKNPNFSTWAGSKDGQVIFRDSAIAFETAIENKKLSADSSSSLYAAKFMYMHSTAGEKKLDYFKHIDSREYLIIPY